MSECDNWLAWLADAPAPGGQAGQAARCGLLPADAGWACRYDATGRAGTYAAAPRGFASFVRHDLASCFLLPMPGGAGGRYNASSTLQLQYTTSCDPFARRQL